MGMVAGTLTLFLLVWCVYSLSGVVLKIPPFASRGRALQSAGLSIFALLGLGLIVPGSTVGRIQPVQETLAEQDKPAGAPADNAVTTEVSACKTVSFAPGDVVRVSQETALRLAPDADAGGIRNDKLSRATGSERFHSIDKSVVARRLCSTDGWSKIEILSPAWMTHLRGWVESAALENPVGKPPAGALRTGDFHWSGEAVGYKAGIVAVVNKILRENGECRSIDPGSLARSASRSSPGDPVFFVACNSGAEMFNVWFRPGDADTGRIFATKKPLAKTAAAHACEARARASSGDVAGSGAFARMNDVSYISHDTGRARVVSSFTAVTGLAVERTYRIDCLFDGPLLVEADISEASD